jgi:hypothetical protein
MSRQNAHKNGLPMPVICIVTSRQLTRLRKFVIKPNMSVVSHPSTSTIWTVETSRFSHTWEYSEVTKMRRRREDSSWLAGSARQHHETRGSEVLPPVAEALCVLYKVWRGLLWREQYRPLNKVSLKFLHFPSPETFGSHLVRTVKFIERNSCGKFGQIHCQDRPIHKA